MSTGTREVVTQKTDTVRVVMCDACDETWDQYTDERETKKPGSGRIYVDGDPPAHVDLCAACMERLFGPAIRKHMQRRWPDAVKAGPAEAPGG